MKTKFDYYVTVSKKMNYWVFVFIPTIFIKRDDVFADEKAYYVVAQWLIFQAYIRILVKK